MYSDSDFTVMEKSSFAAQYLGSIQMNNAVLNFLNRNQTINLTSKDNIITGWKPQNISTFTRTEDNELLSDDGSFLLKCTGIYLVSAIVNLQASKGKYEVKLLDDSNRILSKHYTVFHHDGHRSIAMFKAVNITANTRISLAINKSKKDKATVLKGTSLSAVYIGSIPRNSSEFSFTFDENIKFDAGMQVQTLKNYVPRRMIDDQLIILGDSNLYQIAVPKHGIYIFSFNLHLNMFINDQITMKISVWKDGIKSVKNEEVRTINTNHTIETSMLVTSLLLLGRNDLISVTLESKKGYSFEIGKDSEISFTAVKAQSLAAGFITDTATKVNNDNEWTQVEFNALPFRAFGLNEFLISDRKNFKAPMSGLYFIVMNIICSSEDSKLNNYSIRILKENTRTTPTELFAGTFSGLKKIFTTHPSGVFSLNENDVISFYFASLSNFKVDKGSTVFISLIDFSESGRTFIGNIIPMNKPMSLNENVDHILKDWTVDTIGSTFYIPNQGYTALKNGFYLVACNVQVKIEFLKDLSLDVDLFVHFDDNDMNFGLKDMIQVTGKKNESRTILLTVNEVVKAKANSKLSTVLKLNKKDSGSLNMTVLSGRLSVTLFASNEEELTETFREVQASTKLLSINNNAWKYISKTIYDEKNGEFKTENVEMIGAQFLAKRPMVAYVSSTFIIHGIDGIVDYGMVVLPESENSISKGLTLQTRLYGQTSTTLKWNGFVYLEPWNQLGLAIKRKKDPSISSTNSETSFSRSSWSSYSFIALPFLKDTLQTYSDPSKVKNGTVLDKGLYLLNIDGNKTKAGMFKDRSMKWLNKYDVIPSSWNACNIALSEFKQVWTQTLQWDKQFTNQSEYELNHVFDNLVNMRSNFPLSTLRNKKCIAGIMTIHLRIILRKSNISDISLLYTRRGQQHAVKLASASYYTNKGFYLLEMNGMVCHNHSNAMKIGSQQGKLLNMTISHGSSYSFALINDASHVEGFSAIQLRNQVISLENGNFRRVDGWSIESELNFDSTIGFKSPFATYYVITTGRYLVTANIVLKMNSTRLVKFALSLDGTIILQIKSNQQSSREIVTLNIALVINIQNSQLLELKAIANNEQCHVLAGSTFSAVLLVPEMTFSKCGADTMVLRTVPYKSKAYRIGHNVYMPCTTDTLRTADFYWLQNGKIVSFLPSSTNGSLIIYSASSSNSGLYRCRVQIGDFFVESHDINVFVYDPTPNITIHSFKIFIPENSPPELEVTNIHVKAMTSLGKTNGRVHLSIQPDNLNQFFNIVPSETSSLGVLRTSSTFDHESRNIYNITLVAKNTDFAGNAQSFINLIIHIVDKNDNPPMMRKTNHVIEIFRSASVSESIYKVHATDKDTGKNAQISYALHHSKDAESFGINYQSGDIYLKKKLTEEAKSSFVLFVIAENEQFRAFAQITINVKENNIHKPYFNPQSYTATVPKSLSTGSVITRVRAYDKDKYPVAGKLHFKIVSTSVKEPLPLTIDEYGIIQTTGSISTFAGELVVFNVEAYDNGGFKSSNMAVVNLAVAENKQKSYSTQLKFEKDVYSANIREDVEIGTFVVAVKTFLLPPFSNHQVRYVCLQSGDSGNFTLSETTGFLYTRALFDYKSVSKYSLTIFACDATGEFGCVATKILINIEVVNDNAPFFTRSFYNETLKRNSAIIGAKILELMSLKADSSINRKVIYAIEDDADLLPFSIGRSDGVIKLTKPLNNATYEYIFIVSALNDARNSPKSFCLVQIKIDNDNATVDDFKFDKRFYEISIHEDEVRNKYLQNITVSTRVSTQVGYFLYGNDNHTFGVQESSGSLFLLKKIDFETKKKYQMFLIAKSIQNQMKRAFTKIIINILDINDNAPKFLNENNYTIFYEGRKPGTIVTKVQAYDPDTGENGEIRYSLLSQKNAFGIDAKSGVITVNKIVQGTIYDVIIKASDLGSPSLYSETNMIIRVSNTTIQRGLIRSDALSLNATKAHLRFDIKSYIYDASEDLVIRFIAQEVYRDVPEFASYTELPALKWYDVNKRRNKDGNLMRRFIASEDFVKANLRKRRSLTIADDHHISFIYGAGKDCSKIWNAHLICNGPLMPGKDYRFQLEIKYHGSANFVRTRFTKSYKTGKSDPAPQTYTAPNDDSFAYWIALIITSALLFIILFSILACFLVYRWTKHRKNMKSTYEIGVQKNDASEEFFLPTNIETESQELTVWFSEESIPNGKNDPFKRSSEV
eukprot:gene15992-17602_t